MVAIDPCDQAIDRMGHWIGDVGFSLMDRCSYFQILVGTGTTVPGLVINHFFQRFHSRIFVRTTDTDPASPEPDPGLHFYARLHDPYFESRRLHLVRTVLASPFLERLLFHCLSPPGMVARRLPSCDLLCATSPHASGTHVTIVPAICANCNSLQSDRQWW